MLCWSTGFSWVHALYVAWCNDTIQAVPSSLCITIFRPQGLIWANLLLSNQDIWVRTPFVVLPFGTVLFPLKCQLAGKGVFPSGTAEFDSYGVLIRQKSCLPTLCTEPQGLFTSKTSFLSHGSEIGQASPCDSLHHNFRHLSWNAAPRRNLSKENIIF